jgi:hypothetical protein
LLKKAEQAKLHLEMNLETMQKEFRRKAQQRDKESEARQDIRIGDREKLSQGTARRNAVALGQHRTHGRLLGLSLE